MVSKKMGHLWVSSKVGNDWCHRCGKRDKMRFAEFTIPENAEESTVDGDRGYFRICEHCVDEFATLIKDAVDLFP